MPPYCHTHSIMTKQEKKYYKVAEIAIVVGVILWVIDWVVRLCLD